MKNVRDQVRNQVIDQVGVQVNRQFKEVPNAQHP